MYITLKKFKDYINEMILSDIVLSSVTSSNTHYITDWITKHGVIYEFNASITDDMAVISFYEKDSRTVGAKKEKIAKYDVFAGVSTSIKRLLKDKTHIKRLYFVSVDKDLERYHDLLSRSKLYYMKFDYSERDIHGRKCYWYSRKD